MEILKAHKGFWNTPWSLHLWGTSLFNTEFLAEVRIICDNSDDKSRVILFILFPTNAAYKCE